MSLAGDLLDRLAEIGADPPGITREAFGRGENAAMALMTETARGLGLDCATDAGANLAMRWRGSDPSLPPILIGSHLDSVVQGGNFDGAAGVVAGLAAIAALKAEGFRPRASIEVLALRCEEAVWFGLGLIGSRSLLGRLPPGALDLPHARGGRSLGQCIAECGGDPARLGAPLRDPRGIGAYLELHIEQAPQLIEAGQPVAICLANPGNLRHPHIRIHGEDAHTGLPHRFRRDAAMAGAELALALERLWRDEEAAGRPMAVTIGRFHTPAERHAMTVVPGEFELSLDLRAYDAAHLASLEAKLQGLVGAVAAARRVEIDLGPRSSAAPGAMDATIQAELAAAATARGLAPPRLNSPGSHDANNFAAAGVPTGMLLIRNEGGSHNPHESMELHDLLAAIDILGLWITQRTG
ncbi:hydantoinase/carbamoylase family amidase [Belnapia sp. T6]|uniref:Hydantoinase/carbamoylase family amidase n=1 Tax=Belnapia mucosa TaxID=2804532 RepID=A0ABS1UZS8_9PROT|nr:hydantoinase/carbamoylase family amidase [Belnapia mucosa]MBL6454963.1 hydantoinase/carbamoylase family amidase [Belnapia mucosa]